MDVQTGFIAFTSALPASGEFRAAAGAGNSFAGTQSFTSGASFTGAGTNRITAGSTAFSGTISSTNLEFAGGSATRSASFTGNVAWTGGDWVGGSTFAFSGGTFAIDGTANKNLYHGRNGAGGAIVRIAGNATWLGTGSIFGGDGAGIQIQSGGLFDIRNNSTYAYIGFGNGPFIANAGTLRKSTGTGTTTLGGLTLSNTGAIDVQSGTLFLSGSNLKNDGTITVADAATFHFSGGNGSSSGGFNVNGTGLIRFTAGTQTLTPGATFTGTGLSEIAGGTVNASGPASVGTATLTGRLRLLSGGFGGGATVTVNSGSAFQ